MHAVTATASHVCNDPLVSWTYYLSEVIHHLWLLESPYPILHDEPWALGWGIWHKCPTWGWELYSLLSSVRWPVVGLFANYNLLLITALLMVERSLMMSCKFIVF